jgi:predicted dehydrogenase
MKKALVIGTGSIAEKHIKNLLELNYKVSVYSESKNKIKKYTNINYLENLKNLNIFEFVILANSTNNHLKYLKILIKNKKNIYCEKPIYFKNFNISKIRKDIIKSNILVFVGYQLMVHEKIKFLQKKLNKEKIISFIFKVGHDFRKWRKKNFFKKTIF